MSRKQKKRLEVTKPLDSLQYSLKDQQTRKRSLFCFFLVIIILISAIYSPSINGPFIFDDNINILTNTGIRISELSFDSIDKVLTASHLKERPVSNVSFALNYYFHQYNVFGYHLVNVIIHILNCWLVFFLTEFVLKKETEKNSRSYPVWVPLIVALLWGAHPLQTQSVSYVIQRMTSLATFFYLSSLVLYIIARQTEGSRAKIVLYCSTVVTAILAVGSKEIAVTLPFFIFLFEWYYFQSMNLLWLKKNGKYVLLPVVVSICLVFAYLGSNPFERALVGFDYKTFTIEQRILTEWRVVIFYVGLLLFPHPSRLSFEHLFPLSSSFFQPFSTFVAFLTIILTLCAAVYYARRERLISFAIFWYFGNLVLESTIIPIEIIFEHRVYLPSVFVIIAIVAVLLRIIKSQKTVLFLLAFILLTLSAWTYQRNIMWGDDVSFMKDNMAKVPVKYRMYTNLANSLLEEKKYSEAISYYYQALKLYPYDAHAYLGLGASYYNQGKYKEAAINYRKATRSNDSEVRFRGHNYLADSLSQSGQLSDALEEYKAALQLRPESQEIKRQIQIIEKKLLSRKKNR